MLCLHLKKHEHVRIVTASGEAITVTFLHSHGEGARLGFTAPRDTLVMRDKVVERKLANGEVEGIEICRALEQAECEMPALRP